MMTALTAPERKDLRDCFKEFQAARKDVARGLHRMAAPAKRIRDGELWRETASTWGDYCRDVLMVSQQWANRLIQVAESGLEAVASSMSQAEALIGLSVDEAKLVVQLVDAEEKPRSTPAIKSARQQLAACATPQEQLALLEEKRQESRADTQERERRAALAGGRALLEDAAGRARKGLERLGGHATKADEADIAELLAIAERVVGRIRKREAVT